MLRSIKLQDPEQYPWLALEKKILPSDVKEKLVSFSKTSDYYLPFWVDHQEAFLADAEGVYDNYYFYTLTKEYESLTLPSELLLIKEELL